MDAKMGGQFDDRMGVEMEGGICEQLDGGM